MKTPNSLFHQYRLKGVDVLDKLTKEAKIKTKALEKLAVTADLYASTKEKMPQCPPNPDCFAILCYAYTIGTYILGGEKNFNLKECNDLLKACSKSEQYNHCMEILKENDDLAYQSSQLSKPLQKASLECRTERINMLNLFIFEVIIWCQQKRYEESTQVTV